MFSLVIYLSKKKTSVQFRENVLQYQLRHLDFSRKQPFFNDFLMVVFILLYFSLSSAVVNLASGLKILRISELFSLLLKRKSSRSPSLQINVFFLCCQISRKCFKTVRVNKKVRNETSLKPIIT